MNKKITATIVIIIFMGVSFSCHSYSLKQIELEEGKAWNVKNANVVAVYTKSRQVIEFSKKSPGVVISGEIIGTTKDKTGQKKFVTIPISEVDTLWIRKLNAWGTLGGTLLTALAGLGVFWLYFVLNAISRH